VAADQAGNTDHEPATRATQSVNVDYRYDGFLDPVQNGGVMNVVKAGSVTTLKWRLTDGSSAPITTLSTATITVTDLSCTLGTASDQLTEQAARCLRAAEPGQWLLPVQREIAAVVREELQDASA